MLPVLDRTILKELFYNMAFAVVVITSVFFLGAAVQLLHNYPGLDLWLLLQVMPLQVLYRLHLVLPLSLLMSVVLVYGRAASANEFTTIKASGIHPYRVLLPAFLLALLVTVATAYTSNTLAPSANAKFRETVSSGDNLRKVLEHNLARGDRTLDLGGVLLQWREEDYPEAGGIRLHDVIIRSEKGLLFQKSRRRGEDGDRDLVPAMSIVKATTVTLQFDAESETVSAHLDWYKLLEGPGRGITAEDHTIVLTARASRWSRRLRYFNLAQLVALYQRSTAEEARGQVPVRSSREVLGTIHERLALSTASLFFVLIGAPLALVFKAGNRMVAFLLAIFVGLFVFYPSQLMAAVLTSQGVLPPVLAAWSGSILLAFLGLGLLLFAVRR